MAQVFNLEGQLGLNIAKFTSKIEKATKNLKSFRARASKITRKIKKSFGGITKTVGKLGAMLGAGGVLSGGGLVLLSTRAGAAAREIENLAITTSSTVTEIQGLTLAFSDLNLEADDVGDVLNTIADRSQDAKDGMQSFIDDFALIGITVDDLKGKRPAELFNTFADAVSKTEDPIKRQSAIVRILGDDLGRKLAPALMNGSKHFTDLAKEAEAAGLIMDQATVAAAARASKKMERLKTVIDSGVNKAFARLAPYIEAVTERVGAFVTSGQNFDSAFDAALQNTVTGVGRLMDAFNGLGVVWSGIKVVWNGVKVAVIGGIKGIVEMAGKVATAITQGILTPIKKVLELAQHIPGAMGDAAKGALKTLESIKFEPMILTDTFDAQAEELRLSMEELQAKLAEPPPSEGLNEWFEGVKANIQSVNELAKAYESVRVKAASTATTITTKTDEMNEKTKEFADTVERQIGSALESALEGDFKSIGDNFVRMINRMLAEAMAANIASAIGLKGGATSGGTTSSGGGGNNYAGWAQAAAAIFSSFDGGGFTGGGARSGGVDGKGGFPAILHPNETIVDHSRGQKMGSVYNININPNLTGAEDKGIIRKSSAQMARDLKRELARV